MWASVFSLALLAWLYLPEWCQMLGSKLKEIRIMSFLVWWWVLFIFYQFAFRIPPWDIFRIWPISQSLAVRSIGHPHCFSVFIVNTHMISFYEHICFVIFFIPGARPRMWSAHRKSVKRERGQVVPERRRNLVRLFRITFGNVITSVCRI